MTEEVTINPRRPMAIVVLLALVAAVLVSEAIRLGPGLFAGDIVAALLVVGSLAVAVVCVTLIALLVYAMDRASDRIAHRIAFFDRILEARNDR
jgi:hypothetical protein